MAELDNNILVVSEPSIRPNKIEVPRLDEDEGGDKQTKTFGIDTPTITVNGYDFQDHDIISFNLSITSEIPQLSVRVKDSQGTFDASQYPRDGDVITVYIGSKNEDTFKSIHMDFDIVSIASPKKGLPHSERTYGFSGVAKIPKLFTEECRAFNEGNSLEHIEQVSRNLGLGVATNINSANDSQVRIQAYERTIDFVKGIVNASYIKEEAFQTFYIDQYYYLNFIEVNKIFNSKNAKGEDGQDFITSFNMSVSQEKETEDNDQITSKLYLTNNHTADGTGNKINQWSLSNNSSKVSLQNGYKRILQMYDELEGEKLIEFDIESYTSTNLRDSEEPLKGRRDEDHYTSHIKHKYIGRQQDYNLEGNVHSNHKYSMLNNYQNLRELEKIQLNVELESFNPGLYRYQKLPVIMYNVEPTKVQMNKETDKVLKEKGVKAEEKAFDFKDEGESDEGQEITIDDFVSGHYIIGGIEYIYKAGDKSIRQKLTLLRREWPVLANSIK